MTNDGRCCGGRCGGAEVVSFSRREFLEMLAATTAGLALNSELAGAERGAARPPLSLPKAAPAEYPRTPPRSLPGRTPRSGRHAAGRHRHGQRVAGWPRATGRVADFQQPE